MDPLSCVEGKQFGTAAAAYEDGHLAVSVRQGQALAHSGFLGHVLGGFQVSLAYEYQPGQLSDWGNVFYRGNIADIRSDQRDMNRWFNTDNFERTASRGPAAYHMRVFATRVDGVRSDMNNTWSGAVQREFRLNEHVALQFRPDVMNIQNRSQLAGPIVDPYSPNCGRVISVPGLEGGNGGPSNRWLQVQGALILVSVEDR